ncbi:unnamed protein product [Schistosoma turkestanicum]|nr:unnamed protein product [Schistosoma turkestanicum]
MIGLVAVIMYMFVISSKANPHGYSKDELSDGLLDSSSLNDYSPYYYRRSHVPKWWRTVNEKRWFPIKEYRGGLMEYNELSFDFTSTKRNNLNRNKKSSMKFNNSIIIYEHDIFTLLKNFMKYLTKAYSA